MNDKIEHCLYESGLTAQGCWDELDDYAKEAIERFAVLIIQQCCEAVRDEIQYQDSYDMADDVINSVKKHFGVE